MLMSQEVRLEPQTTTASIEQLKHEIPELIDAERFLDASIKCQQVADLLNSSNGTSQEVAKHRAQSRFWRGFPLELGPWLIAWVSLFLGLVDGFTRHAHQFLPYLSHIREAEPSVRKPSVGRRKLRSSENGG
jgi:hypothetical protein